MGRTKRPDGDRAPVDAGRSARTGPRAAAAGWLRLGLAAILGAAAGATLFPRAAQGRSEARRRPERDGL
ncbi:hypothetical protein [Methylobacterium radiodurans]|uniref:Uncharacterized protein n=1 Tax=Methylobacterium radiodurans TaxID=2202828 RepID=A0A2U8VMZ5_9HYPH|nr:hypothetical protein [Methylobacterium radiodurans]AWN34994.1 hypothetical protein DK427_03910 [Methylobacterium radiodurans]